MTVNEKISELRKLMKAKNIDAYIVPNSDPHLSEYVPERYKLREFITGFTGSRGTAVITMDKAGLWTDSRYFIQAEKQLSNSEVKLYKMGEDISMDDFLLREVHDYGRIGFDGELMSYSYYENLAKKMETRMLLWDLDFISDLWEDRPLVPNGKINILYEEYSGKTPKEKLAILREMMKDRKVDQSFIGGLEDVNYLYNIRGNDIEATPVVISYALVTMDEAYLFVDISKLDDEVLEYLNTNDIKVLQYENIFSYMRTLLPQSAIYLDPDKTNVKVYKEISNTIRIKKGINLTTYMKAVKNDVEIENAKEAFHKDAIALVKFFNWVEMGSKTGNLSEYQTVEKLLELRKKGKNFIENSFGTISAYRENAAMPHYAPSPNESKRIEDSGLFLCDSGGHYLEGTTDITRTIALGHLTKEEKYHYTMTLKAHIMAMSAVFKAGTTGQYIDDVCRYHLGRHGLDFGHSTGHGVGYLLSVHEGPQSFSKNDKGIKIVPGMITSIEPGIYIEGSHGIRIENIVC